MAAATTTSTKKRRAAVPHHRGQALRLERLPDAPDPSDLAGVRRWVRAVPGPTAVDLFAGAGGLSLGLRQAGFTVLLGADSDPWSVETHAGNLGGLGYLGDLSDPDDLIGHLDAWGVRSVDLVAGGPPCQPFSRAGNSKIRSLVRSGERPADDPRAQLWRGFMAVVQHLLPRAVLIENVPDLPRWDDGAVLTSFYEALRELDYDVDARVLDAYRHGVPQHRARLFIVGIRDGAPFEWPEPNGDAHPTLRHAIGDLPPVPPAHRHESSAYFGEPMTGLQRRLRRDLPAGEQTRITDHITRDVRPDDAEAFRLLGEGQTYRDLPARLQRYRTDIFDDKYKRLSWDEVSRSITAHIAKDGYWYIHPDQHRTLSIREAARIQTFPDGYRFAGEPTHRYRQIGNAVPPLLAEALGRSLVRSLKRRPGRRNRGRDGLRADLLAWHADHSRGFPWRRSGLSPWLVLMAEVCLHRTRADEVEPLFRALERLAPAPIAMLDHEVKALEAMHSLDLGGRAENIIAVARALVENFRGRVPDTELELRSLPGVGDYVAQAVLCFGFGRRAVLVDANTARIVSRLHARDDTRRWQLRLDLHRLAGQDGPDAAFNYALLDLGARICRAGSPRCAECPIRRHCATGAGVEAPPQLQLKPAA
jgi:DNA (cytosine-5)-methyltransferase 1